MSSMMTVAHKIGNHIPNFGKLYDYVYCCFTRGAETLPRLTNLINYGIEKIAARSSSVNANPKGGVIAHSSKLVSVCSRFKHSRLFRYCFPVENQLKAALTFATDD